MNGLTQLLTKFASNVQQSQTTNSTYYTIGNIKIRVSDHPARSGSCDLDILHYGRDYIVFPINAKDSTGHCFTNLKDLFEFIAWYEKIYSILNCSPVKREIQLATTINDIVYETWKTQLILFYEQKKINYSRFLDLLFTLLPNEEKDKVLKLLKSYVWQLPSNLDKVNAIQEFIHYYQKIPVTKEIKNLLEQ